MLALSMQKDWGHSKSLKFLSSLHFLFSKILKLPHKTKIVLESVSNIFEINTKINYMKK
jgi:hypothetical protein